VLVLLNPCQASQEARSFHRNVKGSSRGPAAIGVASARGSSLWPLQEETDGALHRPLTHRLCQRERSRWPWNSLPVPDNALTAPTCPGEASCGAFM
jgi:hypothetical protein